MNATLADQAIELAAHFTGPEYTRAGGGDVSYKSGGVLHIKPSGLPLAGLAAADLIPLRVESLLDALETLDSADDQAIRLANDRSRADLNDGRRPSVESFAHALLPQPLVVHLHPLTINALACNERAHELAAEILGDQALVVDYADPGLPLAQALSRARRDHSAKTGTEPPALTILRNHGIFAAGPTAAAVIALVEGATAKIRAAIEARPRPARRPISERFRQEASDEAGARRVSQMIATAAPVLRGLLGQGEDLAVVTADAGDLVRTETRWGAPIISIGPLIPDEIVYAGSFPCVVEPKYAPLSDQIRAAVTDYRRLHGCDPVVVILPGKVLFGVGRDYAVARNAVETFLDALRVAADADRLGQVRVLTGPERGFIETWEAEAYRQRMAETARRGRLRSKVVLITGASQGFGPGIARGLAAEGAHVVLADRKLEAVQGLADELVTELGPGAGLAVAIDVTDEESYRRGLDQVLAAFGGLDLFISNTGIVRPAAVTEQRIEDFDQVTATAYKGYFLGVRTVLPVFAAQHEICPQRLFDIVAINSMAGLAGVRRNFTDAGARFGAIGLTQSFALDLIESGIKVNAVCPGDYLNGPAWSDPDQGLLAQWARAGRVPGATTTDEVRAYLESKVPLGRGPQPEDLVRAILYLVEQQYETGQALPVTGGRIMLG